MNALSLIFYSAAVMQFLGLADCAKAMSRLCLLTLRPEVDIPSHGDS